MTSFSRYNLDPLTSIEKGKRPDLQIFRLSVDSFSSSYDLMVFPTILLVVVFQFGLLSTEFRLHLISFRYHINACVHGDLRD